MSQSQGPPSWRPYRPTADPPQAGSGHPITDPAPDQEGFVEPLLDPDSAYNGIAAATLSLSVIAPAHNRAGGIGAWAR